MAHSFQTIQRLLTTLNRTCTYYAAKPALLSNRARYSSGIAFTARPSPTGFSITFADGPLETILAQSDEANPKPVEALKNSGEKVPKPRESRVRKPAVGSGSAGKKTTKLADTKTSGNFQNASQKKAKLKKRAKKHTESEGSTVNGVEEQRINSSALEESAWHETHEPEIEAKVETEATEGKLRREYPDTRTIADAGQSVRTEKSEHDKTQEADRPGSIPRPLSTYKETWQVQKAVLRNKFAEGWNPRKKLSPDTMDGIRALHAQYPDRYTTPVLAEQFAVSPEAIRRILKSKWRNNMEPEKAAEMKERWAKRHDRIWDIKSQIGLRPPRRGAMKLEDPDQFEEELRGKQLLESYRNA